jgi:hypothetical protein
MTHTLRTALDAHGMPPDEVDAVLGADDPQLVRRYLELHAERLREQLDDRLRALDDLRPALVGMAGARHAPCPSKMTC